MHFDSERIRVVNAPGFDSFERSKAEKAVLNAFDKISLLIQGDFELIVHFKQYEKQGKRKKFAVNARIATIGHSLQAEHVEWNALSALQQALKALEREVRRKLSRHREKPEKHVQQ